MDAKQLNDLGQSLFSKKMSLNTLHQEVAENFYPERADFTVIRSLGTDFAANLMNSYPVLCRRDLGDQFSTMLRPTAKPWFHMGQKFVEKDEKDHELREMFEWMEKTQRNAMYDPQSLFTRATKEADHDYAAFGQAVLSEELINHPTNGPQLLFRSWHLRDVAWQENEYGQIGCVFRKWKPKCQELCRLFRDRVHPKVKEMRDKRPFDEVDVIHMVVDADMYDADARGRPRWSIFYDVANEHVMEAIPIWGRHYIIPRWLLVSSSQWGSQYAHSPAVIAALPDARLIQAMTFTLLEAGEKATNPPMLATIDAVRSDVAVYAGGITWVDNEYDERLGQALRPLTQDLSGFNYGLQLAQDTRSMIRKAFYLDALTMPQRAPEMTAYEVGQRVQEYIRNALPIFEPMEQEYNAAICEETFYLLIRGGAFGSPAQWPKKMRKLLEGKQIGFHFESPLHDVIEQQKGQKWLEAKALLAEAIALDQGTAFIMDAPTALRDALSGIGVPAAWLHSEAEVQQSLEQKAAQDQAQAMLAAMQQSSVATRNIAGAQKDMAMAEAKQMEAGL